MINFDKNELLKIAQLSALKLEDNEINLFTEQIAAILSYVEQLQTIPVTQHQESVRNSNIFRTDKALHQDSSPILAQAPAVDENYFAVPKILDEK